MVQILMLKSLISIVQLFLFFQAKLIRSIRTSKSMNTLLNEFAMNSSQLTLVQVIYQLKSVLILTF